MGKYTHVKRINRNRIVKAQVLALFAFLVIIGLVMGLLIGQVSTPKGNEVDPGVESLGYLPGVDENPVQAKTDKFYFDVPLSHTLQEHIFELCKDEDIPVCLVLAMIEHESGFHQEIVSETDDYGLMQINAINHEWLAEEYRSSDMLNPYQNVFCGIQIIASFYHSYDGDMAKALMAYNMGSYGARKAWESGITSTSYTESVLALYERYEQEVQEYGTNPFD